jgi:hypothetical protein
MSLAPLKERLVSDWCEATRWWSVRWNALGAILLPLMTMTPDMPSAIRDMFPSPVRATVAGLWCLTAIGFRLWSQKKPNA